MKGCEHCKSTHCSKYTLCFVLLREPSALPFTLWMLFNAKILSLYHSSISSSPIYKASPLFLDYRVGVDMIILPQNPCISKELGSPTNLFPLPIFFAILSFEKVARFSTFPRSVDVFLWPEMQMTWKATTCYTPRKGSRGLQPPLAIDP